MVIGTGSLVAALLFFERSEIVNFYFDPCSKILSVLSQGEGMLATLLLSVRFFSAKCASLPSFNLNEE